MEAGMKVVIIAIVLVVGVATLFVIGIRNAFYCPDIGKYVNYFYSNIEIKSSDQARAILYQYYIPANEHDAYNQKRIELREIAVLFKDSERKEVVPMQIAAWDLDGIAIDVNGTIYVKITGCL